MEVVAGFALQPDRISGTAVLVARNHFPADVVDGSGDVDAESGGESDRGISVDRCYFFVFRITAINFVLFEMPSLLSFMMPDCRCNVAETVTPDV